MRMIGGIDELRIKKMRNHSDYTKAPNRRKDDKNKQHRKATL